MVILNIVLIFVFMKKYYMYNWIETKEILVGLFDSDKSFWQHYWNNENQIKEKQFKLDRDCKIWYMCTFN